MRAVRRFALAILLFASTITGTALGASPAAAGRPAPPPVLEVNVTPEGFVVPGPNPRPGGPVTFRVTAEGAHGYWWTVYKLRNGTTLAQFVEWVGQSSSPDPAVFLPAIRSLYENVEYAGGAKIYPGKPIELTQTLTPGIYYFGSRAIPGPQTGEWNGEWTGQSAEAFPSPAAVARSGAAPSGAAASEAAPSSTAPAESQPSVFGWLQVTDEYQAAKTPRISAMIYMGQAHGRNFMVASRSVPRDGRILVRNDSSQPQEAIFLELRPGATDRDIQEYFDAQAEGRPLPPRPFFDSIGGMLALAPGKQLIMKAELPPGRYGVFSWLRTPDEGKDSAALGMHRVMTLR